MDKFTFGDSPAAIRLTEMIIEHDFPSKKITSILSGYSAMVNSINGVEMDKRIVLTNMLYTDYKLRCDSLPAPFNTYTKNVLNTMYKKWSKAQHVNKNKKKRNLLNNKN